MELIVTIITTIASAVIALVVLLKNYKKATNVYFSLLVFFIGLYPLFNYLALNSSDSEQALFWAKLILVSAIPAGPLFYHFVNVFPSGKFFFDKKIQVVLWIWVVVNLSLGFGGMIFQSVEIINGQPKIETGPAVLSFGLLQLLSILGGSSVLFKKYKNATGILKVQLRYIAIGISVSFGLTLLATLIVPVVFNNTSLIPISPLFLLVAVVSIAYTILRHRLLDIRLVIARSLAYLLLLMTLTSMYALVAFGIASLLFQDQSLGGNHMAIYSALAVFLAFTFQPLKRFFDRVTDRIFYQDSYDFDEVLNNLGKVFITKVNSFGLLDDSLRIVVDALKVQYGRLIVVKQGEIYKTSHYATNQQMDIGLSDLEKFSSQITIYDELEEIRPERNLLYERNIHAVLRLTTKDGLIGYLILGNKQRGTIFTKKDVSLLELLSRELAVAIQNARSYEEISQFGEMMKQEVLAATAKLRETNKRLVKLDEAKDEFISMASHQLRTPLTTIKGYLSMLTEGDAGKLSKKQSEFVDMAYVSSERMVHLIADMLNVSRISTGRLTVDKSPFDLVKVATEEVEQLRQHAEARGTKLQLHVPKKKIPEVNLDEGKIRQVIMNFIDNAVYYAPGGEVDVYLEHKDSDIEFRVRDNGIGVPASAQKQLFTKFFRSENAKEIRPDGTGLGLYMAKQVIEIQGGEVVFKSKEGQGSTFGFRFRL